MSLASSTSTLDSDQRYLEIRGICKQFGDFTAVDHVDLVIPRHEIFALLGSSGSGKSTLLRILAGMETATQGSILLDGQDILALPPYRRPTNMMFQSYALFPHMTVEQNIAFGLKQDKMPKDEIAERVGKMLELVQMSRFAQRKPHQLSGGQQQRVALARSLAKQPKLLLLDEPLGALDKKLRVETQLELVNVIKTVGVTCIMVTHDQEEAMTMASRIAIMSEGKLKQVGSPREIYQHPNCRFTASFIGTTNMFEGVFVGRAGGGMEIRSPDLALPLRAEQTVTAEAGATVWFAIRPEDITLSSAAPDSDCNWASGAVHDIAYMGSHSVYHVRLPSGRVVVVNVPSSHWGDAPPATRGAAIHLRLSGHAGVVLTA